MGNYSAMKLYKHMGSHTPVLATLSDVSVGAASNGQHLKYNSTSKQWEPDTPPTSVANSKINDLSDVDTTSVSNGIT